MRPRLALPIWLLGLVLLIGGVALSPPAVNGFEMYLEEAGQPIAGRKVELIVEDTAGNPGTAITRFRKLV